MTPVLTRAQIRAYDALATDECGVPSLVLMENAGRGAAAAIAEMVPPGGRVTIFCGGGNNGGDGFVVGRHLMQRGYAVRALLVGKRPTKGDAAHNLRAYEGVGGVLREDLDAFVDGDCMVDALFGTGLTRDVEGKFADAIARINEGSGVVVALDIPSGIDCDSGRVLGVAVHADLTVTFAHRKIGMLVGHGPEHCGVVEVAPLGLPDESVVAAVGHVAELMDNVVARRSLPDRAADTHKYHAGSVLIVAGSAGKTGAAVLAGRAALRAGAGLVTIATWPEPAKAIDGKVIEVMTAPLRRNDVAQDLDAALEKCAAVAIGPGLGLDDDARRLTDRVVLDWDRGAVVIDADAITHFAGRHADLRKAPAARILTPHEGELGRLLGVESKAIASDRLGMTRRAADETGCFVVLKGQNTLVGTPDGQTYVCLHGNSVLATAGSGDVLTGIAAALACNAAPSDAACGAVYLHAVTADRWRAAHGDRGMIASDLIDGLPATIASIR